MKTSIYILFFAIVVLSHSTASAGEDSSFFKKYTNPLSTCGYALAVSSNEEIGIAGLRYDASGVRSSFFAGADKLGNLRFVNSYLTGGTSDTLSVMSSTPDGAFILAGTTKTVNQNRDILIYKVRSNGTLVWKKRIRGSSGSEVIWGMTRTPTGYILAGTSDLDVLLLKITWQTGKVLWKKTYGDAAAEFGYSVSSTEDGGALVVGVREDNPLLLKVDPSGKLLWHRLIETIVDSGDGAPIVATTPDAYYIGNTTGGADHSHGKGQTGIVISKITPQGQLLWSKHYHNLADSLIGWHLVPAEDGGIILSGQIGTNPTRAIFLRIDRGGRIRWKRMLSETNSAAFFSDALSENHILITGCVGQTTLEFFALKINQKNGLLDGPCSVLKSPAVISGSLPQRLTTFSMTVKNSPIIISTPNVTRNELPVGVREECTGPP